MGTGATALSSMPLPRTTLYRMMVASMARPQTDMLPPWIRFDSILAPRS
jgi:hypothetical protein